MENIQIDEILNQPAYKVVQFFKSRASGVDHGTLLKQYHVDEHDIHDEAKRPDKVVKVSDTQTTQKAVARLSVPLQKLLVHRAAAFLVGEGVKITCDPANEGETALLEAVKQAWHDNKIDYKNRQLVRAWMSETEVAEYWYIQEKAGGLRLRCQIWSHSTSDYLYPFFDEYGDMQAFARGYKIGRSEYMDVWTETEVLNYEADNGFWALADEKVNPLGKIPVIYYTRTDTEWADVQPLIDRFEKMISNFADANDYFASPLVFVKGEITGFAEKGEQGKMITGMNDADVKYITWDQAPEAIKLEKETLQELIFTMSQTPDISFQQMKSLGASVSGVALRLMFLDANLKTLLHQEEIGEGFQRRLNLMKRALGIINPSLKAHEALQMEPEFTFYMPQNEEELIRTLITATGNRAIMSRKTAIENNPYVINAERENEEVRADELGDFGNIVP